MIDTDKYTGHTEGPWDKESDPWRKGNEKTNRGLGRLYGPEINIARIVNVTVEDFNLIADAPLLLAEVKRLNAYLESLFDGGNLDVETYVEYKERIE